MTSYTTAHAPLNNNIINKVLYAIIIEKYTFVLFAALLYTKTEDVLRRELDNKL